MINDAIQAYVRDDILPQYDGFDKAHDRSHADKVIANSVSIAAEYDVDLNMVYVIAACHDLGLRHGRERHEKSSGAIIRGDGALATWFTREQIEIMAQAAEDHRASGDHEPRSMYGKIVAEADRDIDYDTILRRTIQYSLANFPEYTDEQHFIRTYEHIKSKYGEGGYLTLWLNTRLNRERLEQLRTNIADARRFERDFSVMLEEQRR